MVSNSTLLVKTKLSSPVLENRDKRVVASVTGAKRKQLTETAVRYTKATIAVIFTARNLKYEQWSKLGKAAHSFLRTASICE